MARDSTRLLLVLVAGLVIGLGGVAAYVLVVQPAQGRADAREQLSIWEQRWADAQVCVWGAARRSEDPALAMAIARFDPPAKELGCGARIGKLSRPEGPDTGVDEVEAAWTELETRAKALAKEYATYASARNPVPGPLAEAAAAVATAAAALRREAEAPAAPALDPATVADLAIEPVALSGLDTSAIVGARVVGGAVIVTLASDGTRVVLRGPRDIAVWRAMPGGVRSVPGATWAVQVDGARRGVLHVGPIGEDGAVAGGATVTSGPDASVPLAAIGDGDARVLVVGPRLALYRSRDAGRTWAAAAFKDAGGDLVVELDEVAGAADVLWSGGGVVTRWARVTADSAASLPTPVDLDVLPGLTCAAGPARWYVTGDEVIRAGGREASHALAGAEALVACIPDAALARDARSLFRCGEDGCKPVLTDLPALPAYGALDDHGAALVMVGAGLAAAWLPGGERRFVRFPDTMRLLAVVLWSGKLHLVVSGPAGIGIAPIR